MPWTFVVSVAELFAGFRSLMPGGVPTEAEATSVPAALAATRHDAWYVADPPIGTLTTSATSPGFVPPAQLAPPAAAHVQVHVTPAGKTTDTGTPTASTL